MKLPTPQVMATILGISPATTQAWRFGRRQPTAWAIVRIARALDIDPGDLVVAFHDARDRYCGR